MLLAVTDFLSNWWWALLVGAVVVALVVLLALRTEGGRYARDRLLLALPVIGDTIQFALVERFCRVLASMVSAGVSLPEALRVARVAAQPRLHRAGPRRRADARGRSHRHAVGGHAALPGARLPDDPGRRSKTCMVVLLLWWWPWF